MEIKGRQPILVVVAIGLVAVFAAQELVVKRLVQLWKTRSARITELQTQLQQGRTLVEREDAIRRRWAALQQSALSSNSSAAEQQFFQATDRWASTSRVTVNAITPQWRKEKDFLLLQCRMDVAGGMEALTRFLYEFERDPLALKLESLEVGARDKEGRILSMGLLISGLVLSSGTP